MLRAIAAHAQVGRASQTNQRLQLFGRAFPTFGNGVAQQNYLRVAGVGAFKHKILPCGRARFARDRRGGCGVVRRGLGGLNFGLNFRLHFRLSYRLNFRLHFRLHFRLSYRLNFRLNFRLHFRLSYRLFFTLYFWRIYGRNCGQSFGFCDCFFGVHGCYFKF